MRITSSLLAVTAAFIAVASAAPTPLDVSNEAVAVRDYDSVQFGHNLNIAKREIAEDEGRKGKVAAKVTNEKRDVAEDEDEGRKGKVAAKVLSEKRDVAEDDCRKGKVAACAAEAESTTVYHGSVIYRRAAEPIDGGQSGGGAGRKHD